MRLIALSLMAVGLLAQTPLPSPFIGGGGGGGGTPGGSNTQCQYNNSGAFGGISGCTTNGTVVTLVAPALGTPSALVLTNATGLPAASILPGTFGAGNYTVNGNLTVGTSVLDAATSGIAAGGPISGTNLNIFTAFSGPGTSLKTFMLPNADATLLYSGGPLGTPSSGVATSLTSATKTAGDNSTSLATTAFVTNQPIMLVGTNTAPAESGGTTSLNAPTPTNTANGDLEILFLGFAASPGVVTPPSGWTLIPSCTASGNGIQISVYSHTAASEGANIGSASWANSVGAVASTTSYRNASLDVCSASTAAAATSYAAPAITAAAITDRVVNMLYQPQNGFIYRAAALAGDTTEQSQGNYALGQVSHPISNTTVAARSFNSSSGVWGGATLGLSFVAGTNSGAPQSLTYNQHNAAIGSLVFTDLCAGAADPLAGPYATCGIQMPNAVPLWFVAADGKPLPELHLDSLNLFHVGATDGQVIAMDSGTVSIGNQIDTGICRGAAGVLNVYDGSVTCTNLKDLKLRSLISGGTVPGISGCSAGTQTGGGSVGTYSSGTSGTCTVVLTFAFTAPTGWSCFAQDRTTPADVITQTASSTTTATLAGTTVTGDVIGYGCVAY